MPDLDTVEDRAKALGRATKLNCFDSHERKILAEQATVRKVAAEGDVYDQLTRADSFAVVVSGILHKRSTVNRRDLGPGSLIGELPLLQRTEHLRRRTVGLIAKTDAVLLDVPYRALGDLTIEHLDAFISAIAEEAISIIERIDR